MSFTDLKIWILEKEYGKGINDYMTLHFVRLTESV